MAVSHGGQVGLRRKGGETRLGGVARSHSPEAHTAGSGQTSGRPAHTPAPAGYGGLLRGLVWSLQDGDRGGGGSGGGSGRAHPALPRVMCANAAAPRQRTGYACSPWRLLQVAPIYAQLSEQYPQITFLKVDVDALQVCEGGAGAVGMGWGGVGVAPGLEGPDPHSITHIAPSLLLSAVSVVPSGSQEVAQECGVRAMPTFHGYFAGEKVGEVVGADKAKLEALVVRRVCAMSAARRVGGWVGGGTRGRTHVSDDADPCWLLWGGF